jgi:starch phosphorylase
MEIPQPTVERTGRTRRRFGEIVNNLYYSRGANVQSASPYDIYMALSRTVRNHLVERFRRTVDMRYAVNPHGLLLSAEYLLGRNCRKPALHRHGRHRRRGHGGNFPSKTCWPSTKSRGWAMEVWSGWRRASSTRWPAGHQPWATAFATSTASSVRSSTSAQVGSRRMAALDYWEFAQHDDMIPVGFGGHTEQRKDDKGRLEVTWRPAEQVMGEPYHLLVPGYGTTTVNFLRLWRARATREFDFRLFDIGDFASAVEHKVHSETISKVLYPTTTRHRGAEAAAPAVLLRRLLLRDILQRFLRCGNPIESSPPRWSSRLNDTHPSSPSPN